MKCSICNQKGHNKRICKTEITVESLNFAWLSIDESNNSNPINTDKKLLSNPFDMAISLINKQKEKEDKNDIWKNSLFRDLVKLQSNNVGIVGEDYINNLCKSNNIPANFLSY